MTHTRPSLFCLAVVLLSLCAGESARAQFPAPPVQAAPAASAASRGFPGRFNTEPTPPSNGFGSGLAPETPDEDPTPQPSRNVVYLGDKRTAALGPLVQITLNAHATQYEFAPHGPLVAVAGSRTVGGRSMPTLWLCDVNTGAHRAVPIPPVPAKPGSPLVPFTLRGWDGSGRFLLLTQDAPLVPPVDGIYKSEAHLFRVDTGVVPVKVNWVQTAGVFLTPGTENAADFWSPTRRRILLYAFKPRLSSERPGHSFVLYNVARDKARRILLSPFSQLLNWNDDQLMIGFLPGRFSVFGLYNVQTGVVAPTPPPPGAPGHGRRRGLSASSDAALCPPVPSLSVGTDTLTSLQPDSVVLAPAHVLWLTGANTYGRLRQAFVGVTPGPDDPQVAWLPDGSRFGFLAHGDLFLQRVGIRPATLEERYTGKDALTDTEVETLTIQTVTRLRDILSAYVKDHNGVYPSQDEFEQAIEPTLSPDIPRAIDSQPFIFHAPPEQTSVGDFGLTDFVLGEIDLPRVTITLHGDGRVVSVPFAPHPGGFPVPRLVPSPFTPDVSDERIVY